MTLISSSEVLNIWGVWIDRSQTTNVQDNNLVWDVNSVEHKRYQSCRVYEKLMKRQNYSIEISNVSNVKDENYQMTWISESNYLSAESNLPLSLFRLCKNIQERLSKIRAIIVKLNLSSPGAILTFFVPFAVLTTGTDFDTKSLLAASFISKEFDHAVTCPSR